MKNKSIREILSSLRVLYCEIIWALRNALEWCRVVAASAPGKEAPYLQRTSRLSLARKRAALRGILPKVPYWAWGHLHLATAELELELLRHERVDSRAVSGIRIGALGAKELVENDQSLLWLPARGKAMARIYFLSAMSSFLDKQYQRSLEQFQKLFHPEILNLLPSNLCLLAFEHAGGAAMAVDDHHQAISFFKLIPADSQSAETKAAIDYLRSQMGSS